MEHLFRNLKSEWVPVLWMKHSVKPATIWCGIKIRSDPIAATEGSYQLMQKIIR